MGVGSDPETGMAEPKEEFFKSYIGGDIDKP